ncbi:hypothetical protein FA95DRAFT_1542174 [Auriscalpium vulgare]|uniref:Uncharacterized protein n=1 Tax=Auriscalpium vulgare TaxID=40419 RepID=A0ACB8RSA7_9AGAM|nr:hypothetical protein FA95DRAFT_1542174 [Auriscalpium vulgare]
MAPTPAGAKKRKPPTFVHLPADRAKKLKRDWVTKQKIKSKWKAEKRKEGIVTQRDIASGRRRDEGEQGTADDAEDDDGGDGGEAESSEEEDTQPPPRPGNPPKPDIVVDDPTKPSLRELQRQAYSKDSLHTFKSRGTSRKPGTTSRGGRGGVTTGAGRGAPRGEIGGRGQPDMRLRMTAMLEKIKRDLA